VFWGAQSARWGEHSTDYFEPPRLYLTVLSKGPTTELFEVDSAEPRISGDLEYISKGKGPVSRARECCHHAAKHITDQSRSKLSRLEYQRRRVKREPRFAPLPYAERQLGFNEP